jgi:predicted DNA-binding transcriptional regulator YafY
MNSKVVISYTDHHGDTADREIVPHNISFTSTQWHPEPQWILTASAMDRDAIRGFAMKNIHSWKPKE